MGIEMILAVFIVALALGAEPEFQIRIIKLRPATDGAAVTGMLFGGPCLIDLLTIHRLPLHLFGTYPLHITASQEKEQEVGNG